MLYNGKVNKKATKKADGSLVIYENKITFSANDEQVINDWENANGTLTINDWRDNQGHGKMTVEQTVNGVQKVIFEQTGCPATACKNFILSLVGIEKQVKKSGLASRTESGCKSNNLTEKDRLTAEKAKKIGTVLRLVWEIVDIDTKIANIDTKIAEQEKKELNSKIETAQSLPFSEIEKLYKAMLEKQKKA